MGEPSTDRPCTDADVELVAEATRQHHIVHGRTDADGNSPCACDRWWDSDQGPDWDEHLAEVTLDALAAAGRLLPADAETECRAAADRAIRRTGGLW